MSESTYSTYEMERLEGRVLLSSPSVSAPLLHEDFTAETAVSAANWHIPVWQYNGDGTYYGFTQIACSNGYPVAGTLPACTPTTGAKITVQSYNPSGFSFFGTDMISGADFFNAQKYEPGDRGLVVTFVAKLESNVPPGTVGGLFWYDFNHSTGLDNEIDFELVSNDLTHISTNVYADQPLGAGNPEIFALSSPITEWHTYQIAWTKTQVTWLVDGQVIRQDAEHVPTVSLTLHANEWVPGSDWVYAYNANLQPTSNPGLNQVFTMDLASVDISPAPFGAISGRTLTVTGTGEDDVISLSSDGTTFAATVNGEEEIFNTSDFDAIVVDAGDGNDLVSIGDNVGGTSVSGGSGDDTLIDGPGSNTLAGGAGNDVFVFSDAGAAQTDVVDENSGEGTDVLDFSKLGTAVTVNLHNNSGIAVMGNRVVNTGGTGQAGNFEVVLGGLGDDTLLDGSGNDCLVGNGGNDLIVGNGGNDTLVDGEGNDVLTGNGGNDTYKFPNAIAAQTDVVTEQAGGGTDSLGMAILTGAVNVNLNNDAGIAVMANRVVNTGGAGQAANFENAFGGFGNDSITGNAAGNSLVGNGGNDFIVGGGGDDTLRGKAGDDALTGAGGNDLLDGGDGSDRLIGGLGNDTYFFANAVFMQTDIVSELLNRGIDLLDFSALNSGVSVNLNNDASLAVMANRIVNTGMPGQAANFENVDGGSGRDTLTGNLAANVIQGNGARDLIDVVDGISGNDTADGGAGIDTITADSGDAALNAA